MDVKKNLIPEDDYEYEKEIAEKEIEKRKNLEAEKAAEAEKQKQLEKQRDRRIQADKIELMKLKNGVIQESETMKEEHDPVIELHGVEKIKNIWYHFKWIIIFVAFVVAFTSYIIYDTVSRTDPDLTVLMIANNGLQYRQEELQNFFEKYTEDLNGDGEVYVSVIVAPLDNNSHDQIMLANQTKVVGVLQAGDSMMMITDSNTDKTITDVLKSDLSVDFPGNKYITAQGLSLNMKVFADEVEFENMPNDVVLSIREPQETLKCSEEEMKEKYKVNFKVFKKITDDLTAKAEEANDPGLTTELLKSNDSSLASESPSEPSSTK
ncbi:MAG: hypothetical protein ACI4I7_02945 [Oscillospiraceae bacterium]